MAKELTENQQYVLEALRRHGLWRRNCGWTWNTPSGTEKILDALVKKGYAEIKDGAYRPVAEVVER